MSDAPGSNNIATTVACARRTTLTAKKTAATPAEPVTFRTYDELRADFERRPLTYLYDQVAILHWNDRARNARISPHLRDALLDAVARKETLAS